MGGLSVACSFFSQVAPSHSSADVCLCLLVGANAEVDIPPWQGMLWLEGVVNGCESKVSPGQLAILITNHN